MRGRGQLGRDSHRADTHTRRDGCVSAALTLDIPCGYVMLEVLKSDSLLSDEEFDDVEDKATYKSMLTRDERRFKTADRDGNGIATRIEFTAFLHPEEFDYMRDLVVQVESTLEL